MGNDHKKETIREIILSAKKDENRCIDITSISTISGYRQEACRLNREIRNSMIDKGLPIPDSPKYTISSNRHIGKLFIIVNW